MSSPTWTLKNLPFLSEQLVTSPIVPFTHLPSLSFFINITFAPFLIRRFLGAGRSFSLNSPNSSDLAEVAGPSMKFNISSLICSALYFLVVMISEDSFSKSGLKHARFI